MFYLTIHPTHFILRLYGVGLMVKDHSDSERGNPLPPHWLLFTINSKGAVEHWLEWEIVQWVHHEGSIRRSIAPCANALTTELHLHIHTNLYTCYICLSFWYIHILFHLSIHPSSIYLYNHSSIHLSFIPYSETEGERERKRERKREKMRERKKERDFFFFKLLFIYFILA